MKYSANRPCHYSSLARRQSHCRLCRCLYERPCRRRGTSRDYRPRSVAKGRDPAVRRCPRRSTAEEFFVEDLTSTVTALNYSQDLGDFLWPVLTRLANEADHLIVDSETVRAHPDTTPTTPHFA